MGVGPVAGITAKGFTPILNKLGVVKNQLLIFVILASIIISIVAAPLAYSTGELWKEIAGVGLHVFTAFMLLGFGSFYAYAVLLLPANEQQLLFSETVDQSIRAHRGRKPPRESREQEVDDG